MISISQFNGARIRSRRFHNARTPLRDGPDDEDL